MKKIGLIGGVTWVSTQEYYRLLNQKINEKLGGFHAAKLIINSINLAEVYPFLPVKDWKGLEAFIAKEVEVLQKAGADFFTIGSNTISKVGQPIAQQTGLPYIDIYEATAKHIQQKGLTKVALLGTAFTMQDTTYSNALAKYHIEAVVPDDHSIKITQNIIIEELAKAVFKPESKAIYLDLIEKMRKESGIEGAILGCTEIPLLVHQSDADLPLFDTTQIHVNAILDYALKV